MYLSKTNALVLDSKSIEVFQEISRFNQKNPMLGAGAWILFRGSKLTRFKNAGVSENKTITLKSLGSVIGRRETVSTKYCRLHMRSPVHSW
jgi:hypothetical protein